jgi:predicted enzyme related to lactoylglutathione lyase
MSAPPMPYGMTIEALVKRAGGVVTKGTFNFPGSRRFHFHDPADKELAAAMEAD